MGITIVAIISALVAYLVGSIPTAVWYGKTTANIDVREHGSGNAGATNTFRVLGTKAGIIVMIIDIAKGFFAANLPFLVNGLNLISLEPNQYVNIQLLCGMCSVLGHIFPLYANFKGGKGVATLLGMIIAINPIAALFCIVIFLIIFFSTKYVSLGSMSAGVAFPLLLLIPKIYSFSPSLVLVNFGFVLSILLILTHRKNIKRLISGEESKAFSGQNRK